MNVIPDNLLIFLNQNKVITVCLVDNKNHPYCINCFYVFDENSKCLIFKSSHGTYHQGLIKDSASVSGTILPEKIDTLKLRGIQFTGKLISSIKVETLNLNSKYLKKYPFGLDDKLRYENLFIPQYAIVDWNPLFVIKLPTFMFVDRML